MKNKYIIICLLLFGAMGYCQSNDQNYIISKTYKHPMSSPGDYGLDECLTNITYFDGLGRPIEKVGFKQSGNSKNLVTLIEYDSIGRQPREYLPVVLGSDLNYTDIDGNHIINIYNTHQFGPTVDSTSTPFSEKLFEASPLNRVLKHAAPGDDWAMGTGHEVKLDYQTNRDGEVRLLRASTTWNDSNKIYDIALLNQEFYHAGELYKTITTDENNHSTAEFKDKEGRVVLKRVYIGTIYSNKGEAAVPKKENSNLSNISSNNYDTYYVYDEYGNLTYVLPPLVDFNQGVNLDGLCYQYKYDYRNRLVEKKLPGKQWEFIVYNSQDKPVMTGPALNPWGEGNSGWMLTKYDAFGRVVYTGWLKSDVYPEGRAAMQDQYNNMDVNWKEKFVNDTMNIDDVNVNYTNDVFPTDFKLLTVTYYDGYTYQGAPDSIPDQIMEQNVLQNVKGLTTGSWVRVLTAPDDTNAELTYMLYDSKSRVIERKKTNWMCGHTIVDSKLDF